MSGTHDKGRGMATAALCRAKCTDAKALRWLGMLTVSGLALLASPEKAAAHHCNYSSSVGDDAVYRVVLDCEQPGTMPLPGSDSWYYVDVNWPPEDPRAPREIAEVMCPGEGYDPSDGQCVCGFGTCGGSGDGGGAIEPVEPVTTAAPAPVQPEPSAPTPAPFPEPPVSPPTNEGVVITIPSGSPGCPLPAESCQLVIDDGRLQYFVDAGKAFNLLDGLTQVANAGPPLDQLADRLLLDVLAAIVRPEELVLYGDSAWDRVLGGLGRLVNKYLTESPAVPPLARAGFKLALLLGKRLAPDQIQLPSSTFDEEQVALELDFTRRSGRSLVFQSDWQHTAPALVPVDVLAGGDTFDIRFDDGRSAILHQVQTNIDGVDGVAEYVLMAPRPNALLEDHVLVHRRFIPDGEITGTVHADPDP